MALEPDESRAMKAELGSKRSWPCLPPLLHMSAGSLSASRLNERVVLRAPLLCHYLLSITHLSLWRTLTQKSRGLFDRAVRTLCVFGCPGGEKKAVTFFSSCACGRCSCPRRLVFFFQFLFCKIYQNNYTPVEQVSVNKEHMSAATDLREAFVTFIL